MKNKLTIDIDTSRSDPGQVLISKPDEMPKDMDEVSKQVMLDLGCCCEAVVTLIRLAEEMGIKSGPDSLRACIDHITHGFADADYQSFLADGKEVEGAT